MSSTRIIPRRESGFIPEPSGRGRVRRPASSLLIHYTGGSGPQLGDGRSDAQHMASLHSAGVNMGKPYEYNYVVTYPGGWCWEWAGEFQAAHCANANEWSYGVQCNLGVGGDPAPMIDTVRWLAFELVRLGQLTPGFEMVPHYHYRTTACPGNTLAEPPSVRWPSPTGEGSLGNVRAALRVPWLSPFPPPPPPPSDPAPAEVAAAMWG